MATKSSRVQTPILPFIKIESELSNIDAHEIIFDLPLNWVAKQWLSAHQSAMADFVQSLRSEIDALEESIRTSPDPRAEIEGRYSDSAVN
jgi:hypothetical protein